MYQKRVKEWLDSLSKPSTIEVRYRDEIVDALVLTDDANTDAMADELLDFCREDGEQAGRSRVYSMVSIDETNQRWVLPLRIRQNVDKASHEMQRELAHHNIELIKMLQQERRDDRKLLLSLAESLGSQLKREQDANDRYRVRAQEHFRMYEEVESKHLERKLELERHEQNQELKERFADVLVPLLVATAAKYTGNALPLPPANTKELAIREVAKAMNENQLDALQAVLEQRWPEFKTMLDNALSGQVDVIAFRAFADSLPPEVQMAVIQSLNVGQQAALATVLDGPN